MQNPQQVFKKLVSYLRISSVQMEVVIDAIMMRRGSINLFRGRSKSLEVRPAFFWTFEL